MTLAIVTATCGAACFSDAVNSWQYDVGDFMFPAVVAIHDQPMMAAYDEGWQKTHADIVAHLHDDVLFTEPAQGIWDRVMKEFDDLSVGVVGFCGATALGDTDLYKKPYVLQQLARRNVLSNMEDAETHGKRFTGECDVATLDGFALIVRRSILQRAGGWPVSAPIGYWNYDHWISLMARRFGYRTRLIGASVLHLGGQTVIGLNKGGHTSEQYDDAHRYLYEEFCDVLPISVEDK